MNVLKAKYQLKICMHIDRWIIRLTNIEHEMVKNIVTPANKVN